MKRFLVKYNGWKHKGTQKVVMAANPHAAANRAFRLGPGWHYDESPNGYPPLVVVTDPEGRQTRFYEGDNG